MTRRYFGTDGIRGRAGQFPMTPEFVLKLGWAAGKVLAKEGQGTVLIGKDTRLSGYLFESALEAGLAAAGLDVAMLGPMPTPAVAYLTRALHGRAGVVISASHNPHEDNGIKFFSARGTKLPDAIEEAIEALLDDPMETVAPSLIGKARRINDAPGRYIEFCKATVAPLLDLEGRKIVVDCAHGATYQVAPAILRELGAEVITIGVNPDGRNINAGVGSTHPRALIETVLNEKAALGIALDGDGDRCLLVDETGAVLDGDDILFILAGYLQVQGRLQGPIVGTLMSNVGLEIALREQGLGFERAAVGDRYVHERLLETGGVLGGESSGHMLVLDRTTTGDGMVTALQVLAALQQQGEALSALRAGFTRYPQKLHNVRLAEDVNATELMASSQVQAAVAAAEAILGDSGRVLLRPSGTEPLLRIMVEARDAGVMQEQLDALRRVVETQAG